LRSQFATSSFVWRPNLRSEFVTSNHSAILEMEQIGLLPPAHERGRSRLHFCQENAGESPAATWPHTHGHMLMATYSWPDSYVMLTSV
jgi:hypothetical protein